MSVALVTFLFRQIFYGEIHLTWNFWSMKNFHENIYGNPLLKHLLRVYDGDCRMKCWMNLKSRIKTSEWSLVPICILSLHMGTAEWSAGWIESNEEWHILHTIITDFPYINLGCILHPLIHLWWKFLRKVSGFLLFLNPKKSLHYTQWGIDPTQKNK